MKTFFCILALVYTAFASNEQYSLDVLLKQYEAMTGSSWSDAAADIDIPVEDEDDSIDGDDNDDDDDDSDSKDVKNLPEYNGHDIIGETGRQSGTHFVWKTEDYEPLVHSFAKDGIDCEDLETCEVIGLLSIFCKSLYPYTTTTSLWCANQIHCTGEYGCYATEINGNSAKKVILNCSGEVNRFTFYQSEILVWFNLFGCCCHLQYRIHAKNCSSRWTELLMLRSYVLDRVAVIN